MELNNIKLPASLIAELYDTSLVESNEPQIPILPEKPIVEAQPDQRKWLGENYKKILIIVNHREFTHLPDNELAVLTRMLTACGLSLADVALVNINDRPETGYKEMITQFKSKIVLLFGVDPSSFQLPMSFPHFQVQNFAGTTYLFSPTISELEKDNVRRRKLWDCLRSLFNV